jgi:hypothetical protein
VRPTRTAGDVRLALAALTMVAAACGQTSPPTGSGPPADRPVTTEDRTEEADDRTDRAEEAEEAAEPTSGGTGPGPVADGARARPDWLGTRVLPIAADGFGERLPTPPELVDRRLLTPALPGPTPPPPPSDGSFRGTIEEVPDSVAARSTWEARCPVALSDLRYLTVTFVGFDARPHTGELLVHADVAETVVGVFAALHAARFPLEEVRVIAAVELDLPPTGDGNVTSAFVCRPTVGGTRWSEHAYGRAVDINPFHNPYVRGDLVLPELAGSYVDRSDVRPGMVVSGDVVTRAFSGVGWGWGGDWTGAATDPMHFSTTGR